MDAQLAGSHGTRHAGSAEDATIRRGGRARTADLRGPTTALGVRRPPTFAFGRLRPASVPARFRRPRTQSLTVHSPDLGRPRGSEPLPEAEHELVERARTDPDAFAELYRRYVHAVHAFAYRRSRSMEVADEITSSTFERA